MSTSRRDMTAFREADRSLFRVPSPGVSTRGKKVDAMKQEREIDQAVDDADADE